MNKLSVSLVCLALGAAFASGCATTATRHRWLEVRSPRFLLWTDEDPETAREIAGDLERYHEVLLATTSAEEHDTAPPLRIFLARDSSSLADLIGARRTRRPGLMLSGLFVPTDRGNFAVAESSNWSTTLKYLSSGRSTLFHEYAHAVLAMNGSVVPSWYNEGFAEYMSTTTFADDGSFTIGCPPVYRTTYRSRVKWVPLQQILEADSVARLMRSETGFGTTTRAAVESYLQSWYVFHYFASDGARKKQLHDYLELWAQGTPTAEAVERAFGAKVAELDARIERYSLQSTVGCVRLEPKDGLDLPEIRVRQLLSDEVLYRIGDVMLATHGPTDEVLEVLREAVNQLNAPAMRALARAHLMRAEHDPEAEFGNELQQAVRHLEHQRRLESGSAEAASLEGDYQRLIAARMEPSDRSGRMAALERARASYRQAIRIDDTLAEAYLGLGLTYTIVDNGSEEGVAALEAAAYLLPLNVRPALAVGRLHMARGDKDKARPALRFVLRWAADDETREVARRLLEDG